MNAPAPGQSVRWETDTTSCSVAIYLRPRGHHTRILSHLPSARVPGPENEPGSRWTRELKATGNGTPQPQRTLLTGLQGWESRAGVGDFPGEPG